MLAPHYARADECHCAADMAMVRASPSTDAVAVTQLVHGEGFAVLDRVGAWAWGRCLHDDYVGYVPAAALGPVATATHRIDAPLGLVFARPTIKAPALAALPIGARLAAVSDEGDFLRVERGFVHRRHAAPLDEIENDPVAVAERLIGAPYLWGGRGGDGIDCSGLVQVAFGFAGIAAPRDSDQQRDALGDALTVDEPLRRGDLIFFPGHVGLMVDATHLIHANAYWMAVTVEPLADVVARLQPLHDHPISARRRLTE
ncbi:C40 family peptidase [Sphingomonas nostoxanthinifaciens]|uniref:C40 family peptidase n=1 Tax=Sphingomonas nostoxanthinifaciens TaxID=2872652 RepID=UPI001CC1F483|nr:NlpC/P60 family protein [Sphingomonas nostoxanthinifaciens]UAK22947.1 C40 family peptidase [Sphingomonas nostoxanthinifaciens]